MKYNSCSSCCYGHNLRTSFLVISMLFFANSFFAKTQEDAPAKVMTRPVAEKKFSGVYGSNMSKDESLDYSKQSVHEFEVKPLTHDQQFKKGLDTDRYRILIKGWLNYKYKNGFNDNTWASKYFIKALAQMTYSMNGTLPAEDFNQVLEGRKTYFIADSYIKALKVKPEIKYALAKLYAASCIYTRKVKSLKSTLTKIKKIPSDAILYQIQSKDVALYGTGKSKNDAAEKMQDDNVLGNYVGISHGANLYYICASYYDNFMNMPLKEQIQFINTIYSYNPTLMLAPDIKRNFFLFGYIKQLFFPEKAPEALKYCLRGEVNWLILPPLIKQKTEIKESAE
jgi:hypothetical protein